MTRYLLDTSVLVDMSKGPSSVATRVRGWLATGDEVAISLVQVAECFSGVMPHQRRAEAVFLESFAFWPITSLVARRAGAYRYAFARQGIQLSAPDALIAGLARARRAVLVTGNTRHFPMTDITIVRL